MSWLIRGYGDVSGSGQDRKQSLGDGTDLGDSTDFTTAPRRVVASRARKSGVLFSLMSVSVLCLGWTAERASAQAQQLKILTPLYARPGGESSRWSNPFLQRTTAAVMLPYRLFCGIMESQQQTTVVCCCNNSTYTVSSSSGSTASSTEYRSIEQ